MARPIVHQTLRGCSIVAHVNKLLGTVRDASANSNACVGASTGTSTSTSTDTSTTKLHLGSFEGKLHLGKLHLGCI